MSKFPATARDFTPEKLLELRQPFEVSLSPDGHRVAFATANASTDTGEALGSYLWSGPADGPIEQVTNGPGTDRLPKFSPDGRRIAFASDRDHIGRSSLYLLGEDGEPAEHDAVKGSIEDLQWSADGTQVHVLAADLGSDSAGANVSKVIDEAGAEHDPLVKRPSQAWRRLFSIDASSGETKRLSPPDVNVWEFHSHRAGPALVASGDPSESAWYDSYVGILDPDTGEVTSVYRPEWQVQSPQRSPDGSKVAFVEGACSDRLLVTAAVIVVDLEGGAVHRLATDHEAAQLRWVGDDRLAFVGRRRLDSVCGFVSLDGEVDEVWSGHEQLGRLHFSEFAVDENGSCFAASKDTLGAPPEVCVLDTAPSARSWAPITSLNQSLEEIPVPEVQELRWKSEDGLEIEGLVLTPPGDGAGPLPLVVSVHGGPTLNWAYGFAPGYLGDALCLANAGYAVLLPNPRGSTGRGPEFARANLGDLGGGDYRDILAGVEACVEAGIADSDRVGITGVSGGGLMSAWAITQTQRFAAAVPRSCVSNWMSFHNTANVPRFDELFLEADPYDPTGNYFKLSPVSHSRGVRTPTLIMHGELDLITPVGQAEELYNALVEAGCVTEMVIYPREGHGHAWAERPHLLDFWRRMLAWFDRYLDFGATAG